MSADVGRRPALTSRVEHALSDLVAAGLTVSAAARELGISDATVRQWLHLGADREGFPGDRYARFVASVEAAKIERQHYVRELAEALRERVLS